MASLHCRLLHSILLLQWTLLQVKMIGYHKTLVCMDDEEESEEDIEEDHLEGH